MLKAAIKRSGGEDKVRHRVIPTEIINKWKQTLDGLKEEIQAVLREEKEEKAVRRTFFWMDLGTHISFSGLNKDATSRDGIKKEPKYA